MVSFTALCEVALSGHKPNIKPKLFKGWQRKYLIHDYVINHKAVFSVNNFVQEGKR